MAYRNSAVAGASTIGLMIALFDRLTADLRRAAEAIRRGDIEARCDEINHGFLILGQLESWLDSEKGGEPARQLSKFYAHIRGKIMQASVTQSVALIEEQIEMIVHIRTSWQLLDMSYTQVGGMGGTPIQNYGSQEAAHEDERVHLSQSV